MLIKLENSFNLKLNKLIKLKGQLTLQKHNRKYNLFENDPPC